MSKMLAQLLAPDNLIGAVQTVVNGIPEDILPPAFFNVTERFSGNQGRYVKTAGTQQAATVVNYGSPAAMRNKWGLGSVPVTLLHTFESITFDPLDLANLLAEDNPTKQAMGRQTVERNLANFGQLFRNLRISAVHSALSLGTVSFSATGALLPSTGSAAFSVDYGVSAGHKDQLGGIIAADWDKAATDIAVKIKKKKKASLKATGKKVKYAFYGSAVPGYLMGNTIAKALIGGSPSLSEQFARGATIPDGFMGLTWIPGNQAFYEDADGTDQDWWAADKVVFTPEPDATWWGCLEGGYITPRSIEIAADGMAALGNFQEVLGAFSYASVAINPPGITHYAGDTFLPVLTNPDAIWIADVKAT